MRIKPQWHVHMNVSGTPLQIDLTEEYETFEDVVDWVDDYFRDNPDEWITLPQVGTKTVVTMIRKKEVKLLTIKYW